MINRLRLLAKHLPFNLWNSPLYEIVILLNISRLYIQRKKRQKKSEETLAKISTSIMCVSISNVNLCARARVESIDIERIVVEIFNWETNSVLIVRRLLIFFWRQPVKPSSTTVSVRVKEAWFSIRRYTYIRWCSESPLINRQQGQNCSASPIFVSLFLWCMRVNRISKWCETRSCWYAYIYIHNFILIIHWYPLSLRELRQLLLWSDRINYTKRIILLNYRSENNYVEPLIKKLYRTFNLIARTSKLFTATLSYLDVQCNYFDGPM